MLLNLPIIKDNNFTFKLFKLKLDDKLTIYPYEDEDLNISIPFFNSINCFQVINIYLPYKLNIINNKYLLSVHFFLFTYHKKTIDFDFFSIIFDHLKLSFISFDQISNLNLNDYFSLKFNYNKEFEDIYSFLNTINSVINFKMNYYMYIIFLNLSDSKKKEKVINNIKELNISFYNSDKYNFQYHLDYIHSKDYIKNKLIYKKTNTYIELVKINDIKNNNVIINDISFSKSSDNISIYPVKLKITKNMLFFNFLLSPVYLNFMIKTTFLKRDYKIYKYIFKFFLENKADKLLSIISLSNIKIIKIDYEFIKYDKLYLIVSENINFNIFLKITDKPFNNNILIELFKKYTFPFNFKNNFTDIFEKILYYSFKNINYFNTNKFEINANLFNIINNKIKFIYLQLLKFYYNFTINKLIINEFSPLFLKIIKTSMFINDNLISLFSQFDHFATFKEEFINYIFVYDVNKFLTCNNLLDNFKYIIYLKNKKYNFKFMNNYLKETLTNNLSYYKYIPQSKKKYITWTKLIKDDLYKLFFNQIFISEKICNIIGELIYYIFLTNSQSIDDKNYVKLILFARYHKDIIINNNRINIKINEFVNFNLGFFAKHILKEINIFYDKYNDNNKLSKNEEVLKITKKYYKYKSKYFKQKI